MKNNNQDEKHSLENSTDFLMSSSQARAITKQHQHRKTSEYSSLLEEVEYFLKEFDSVPLDQKFPSGWFRKRKNFVTYLNERIRKRTEWGGDHVLVSITDMLYNTYQYDELYQKYRSYLQIRQQLLHQINWSEQDDISIKNLENKLDKSTVLIFERKLKKLARENGYSVNEQEYNAPVSSLVLNLSW